MIARILPSLFSMQTIHIPLSSLLQIHHLSFSNCYYTRIYIIEQNNSIYYITKYSLFGPYSLHVFKFSELTICTRQSVDVPYDLFNTLSKLCPLDTHIIFIACLDFWVFKFPLLWLGV